MKGEWVTEWLMGRETSWRAMAVVPLDIMRLNRGCDAGDGQNGQMPLDIKSVQALVKERGPQGY